MKPSAPLPFATLTREDVRALAHRLRDGDGSAVDTCVQFVCAETRGLWHGRGRAMICRRLKHVALTPAQRQLLVTTVCARLQEGRFSEQFRDQLRLAVVLDGPTVRACAQQALQSEKPYVRRLALWVGGSGRHVVAGELS
jgi:hypothetical protein